MGALKLQHFRKNDLLDDGGKQFELGKTWCSDFLEIDESLPTASIQLVFKPLETAHSAYSDKVIELKLAEVSNRGDRKAYVNSISGRSQIKDFFINDLGLSVANNLNDFFAIYKDGSRFFLYVIPYLLYNNFVRMFETFAPQVSIHHAQKEHTHNEDISPRQIIYYGAPGTGKSHRIKEKLEGENVPKANIFRTTFHPDSDYSTFVGAYKPTRGKKFLYGLNQKETILYKGEDNQPIQEDVITYNFVPQAFLQAYIKAYEVPNENVYLVIEEINRGNCAQIFGDLFQLLDRDGNGKSDYTIKADSDLRTFLEDEFKKLGVGVDGIKDGELCLPPNLYIYATMNTSDQSLFPIDSAFKRRWDWEYEPIKYKNKDWKIDVQGHIYNWVEFQEEVNHQILGATSSEDKMLGDYFVNPNDGVITKQLLLNKVLFYLWNDVCKDGEGDIFKVNDKDVVTFSELHRDDDKLIQMMDYLKVQYDNRNGVKPDTQTETTTD